MKKFSARQKFLKEQTNKDYQVYYEANEYSSSILYIVFQLNSKILSKN